MNIKIKNIKAILIKSFLPIFASVMLVAGVIYAWQEPGIDPPDSNVDAPINISNVTQQKEGALGIGGLLWAYSDAYVSGKVGIGTTDPGQKLDVTGRVKISDETSTPAAGTIRWSGTDFEGYNGTQWISLTATSSGVNTLDYSDEVRCKVSDQCNTTSGTWCPQRSVNGVLRRACAVGYVVTGTQHIGCGNGNETDWNICTRLR